MTAPATQGVSDPPSRTGRLRLELLEEAPGAIAAETEELHPADLADVAELLPRDKVRAFFSALSPERGADVLEYLNEEIRTELLEEIPTQQAAALVSQMTPDDRADALEEMDEEVAEEIVSELPAEAREETERLLKFEPDTAGGLMTTEFVSVSGEMHVDQALEAVRALARSGRREATYAIYATDANGRLAGVLSLYGGDLFTPEQLTELGVDPSLRAENISVAQYCKLANWLSANPAPQQ